MELIKKKGNYKTTPPNKKIIYNFNDFKNKNLDNKILRSFKDFNDNNFGDNIQIENNVIFNKDEIHNKNEFIDTTNDISKNNSINFNQINLKLNINSKKKFLIKTKINGDLVEILEKKWEYLGNDSFDKQVILLTIIKQLEALNIENLDQITTKILENIINN